MKNIEFRQLTASENEILDRLFEINFSGREQLLRQRRDLLAKTIDENGSIQFKVRDDSGISAYDGMVVEGRCPLGDDKDDASPAVNFLLHVKNGRLWMLEIYMDDSSIIIDRPNPKKIVLFTPKPVAE